MIIKGGEPPFIENPEPWFGGVINKLNELVYKVQQKTEDYNVDLEEKIVQLQTTIDNFVTNTPIPIDTHVNTKGAVHGETKSTVGLSKKDNFRTATVQEQKDGANVSAFCTPQGVKAAIDTNSNFDVDSYQHNDLFSIAALHTTNFFPTLNQPMLKPTYFLNGPTNLTVMGDEYVLSPSQPTADRKAGSGYSMFLSDPYKLGSRAGNQEYSSLTWYLKGHSWGPNGSLVTEANPSGWLEACLFRPLTTASNTRAGTFAYPIDPNLVVVKGEANFLLYDSYATTKMKGFMGSVDVNNETDFTIYHYFFIVNSSNTIVNAVDGQYLATYNLINDNTGTKRKLNQNHVQHVTDYVNLPSGVTAKIRTDAVVKASTALAWNIVNKEVYLNIAIPVTFTNTSTGVSVEKVLRFTESYTPGDLVVGSVGAIKTVGTLVKDTVTTDLLFLTSQWFSDNDPADVLNPVGLPGTVSGEGYVINSFATKNSVKVKYSTTSLKGILDLIKNGKNAAKAVPLLTRTFTPGRFLSFGDVPDRIIPISNEGGATVFLSYQVDNTSGRYAWLESNWSSDDIGVTPTNNVTTFGVRTPDNTFLRELSKPMNSSLVVTVGAQGGVTLSSKAFTFANNFKTTNTFSYNQGIITSSGELDFDNQSYTAMSSYGYKVIEKAKALYGTGYEDYPYELTMQAYCISDTDVLVVITDGLAYGEAGLFKYQIIDNSFNFILPLVESNFKVVTQSGLKPKALTEGQYRESLSGDGVNLTFADVLLYKVNTANYYVNIPRAFGNLYGDVSFYLKNVTGAMEVIPQITNPARLYKHKYCIDVVNELYPAVVVPRRGMYAVDPTVTETDGSERIDQTIMKQIDGTLTFDPYLPPDRLYCFAPEGLQVILGGRSFILDKTYYLPYDGTNTHYYIERQGDGLTFNSYPALQEPSNNAVLFMTVDSASGFIPNRQYIVVDNHVLSYSRRGSAIPVTENDGGKGSLVFFKKSDIIT